MGDTNTTIMKVVIDTEFKDNAMKKAEGRFKSIRNELKSIKKDQSATPSQQKALSLAGVDFRMVDKQIKGSTKSVKEFFDILSDKPVSTSDAATRINKQAAKFEIAHAKETAKISKKSAADDKKRIEDTKKMRIKASRFMESFNDKQANYINKKDTKRNALLKKDKLKREKTYNKAIAAMRSKDANKALAEEKAVANKKGMIQQRGMGALSFMFQAQAIKQAMTSILVSTVSTFTRITESQTEAGRAVTSLTAGFEYLKFTIGNAIATALMPFVPAILDIIDGVADFTDKHQDLVGIGIVFVLIGAAVVGLLASFTLLAAGFEMLTGIDLLSKTRGIVTAISNIGTAAQTAAGEKGIGGLTTSAQTAVGEKGLGGITTWLKTNSAYIDKGIGIAFAIEGIQQIKEDDPFDGIINLGKAAGFLIGGKAGAYTALAAIGIDFATEGFQSTAKTAYDRILNILGATWAGFQVGGVPGAVGAFAIAATLSLVALDAPEQEKSNMIAMNAAQGGTVMPGTDLSIQKEYDFQVPADIATNLDNIVKGIDDNYLGLGILIDRNEDFSTSGMFDSKINEDMVGSTTNILGPISNLNGAVANNVTSLDSSTKASQEWQKDTNGFVQSAEDKAAALKGYNDELERNQKLKDTFASYGYSDIPDYVKSNGTTGK